MSYLGNIEPVRPAPPQFHQAELFGTPANVATQPQRTQQTGLQRPPVYPSSTAILVFSIIGIPLSVFAVIALMWSLKVRSQISRGDWSYSGRVEAGFIISAIWVGLLAIGGLLAIVGVA